MMKFLVFLAVCLLTPTLVGAQNTLSDQINAVDAARQRQQADERAAERTWREAQQAEERRVAERQRAAAVAVDAARQRQQAEERAAEWVWREARQAEERLASERQRAAAVAQEQREEAVAAAQKQRQDAAAVQQQRKEDELLSDKKRDQAYQDQLRTLNVQQKLLVIEAEKARVARANEFIDQDLKERAALTDVVQSNADATRDLSAGTKALLEKTGEAAVKSQSGLFK